MPFDDRDFPNLPKGERAMSPRSRRLVAIWLYAVAAMILVMVALGGATRVTGSGLSIMEWAPIMGTLPPLSDVEWHRLYALYQQTPQYNLVNDGFGLAGFKQIFWLEWTHRLWGRLIGAAFVLPLLWFALTGRLELRLIPRLAGFLLLGGLQGAVGWFMVESGFFPDATAVEPVRLVAHLGLALILYGMVLWTALTLLPPRPRVIEAGPSLKVTAWATLGMVALTIVAGGFVAGLHAGLTYNTFPWMDGQLVPDGYADLEPFARNLIANVPAVQFDHRLLATMTLVLASVLAAATWPYRERLGWRAAFLGAAVVSQYALGVATLLLVVPAGLAVLHQIGATVLLTAILLIVHATSRASRPVPRSVRGTAHGQTLRGTPLYRSADPSSARQSASPGSGAPRSVTEDPKS
jgi:cytochrome c oxidase assembly protein subunit 15